MQNQATKAPETRQSQGYFGNPQVFLTKRDSMVHILGNDLRIEMPVNFYKKILGISFEKKEPTGETPIFQRPVYGLIARPVVYVKGEYLVHSVLGIRVSKHVNYYRRILEATAPAATTSEALPA